MKRRVGQKLIFVVILSLFLAGQYAAPRKRAGASETEPMKLLSDILETESERESESEAVSEQESESEGESGTETGNDGEGEQGSESDEEGEQESETAAEAESGGQEESESETGTESESESESEVGTEAESGGEGEQESETGTESESESESEVDTEAESGGGEESESEATIKAVKVTQIGVVLPKEGRIYDGTNQIALSYVTKGLETEAGIRVCCESHLAGSDVGEWPVEYRFWLEGEGAEGYQLEAEEVALTVLILPRPLTVILPDGWKSYGQKTTMEQIHLLDEVKVEGFLKDEAGKEIIPKEFKLPQVAVDTSVVEQWSNIYQNGKQKVYKDALVMKKDKKGMLLGNATKNYVFSEDEKTGRYQKGSLVIAQTDILPGLDYQIQGEAGAWHTSGDGSLWVRQGTGLQMVPLQGRGYNRGVSTGALEQSGSFSFSLKKINKKGEIVADSLERWISYQVDGSVPEALLEMTGGKQVQGTYYGKGPVQVKIRIPSDSGSGIKGARYLLAMSDSAAAEGGPVQGEGIPTQGEGWQDCTGGIQLQLVQQGRYVIYVETEDNTGNKAYVKSEPITVDMQIPEIYIFGVADNSANNGAVSISVECGDANYKKDSLRISITGANGAAVPQQKKRSETKMGEQVMFQDFPYEKQADDIYTVTVTAEDLAGNKGEKSITFSINRFGSVYDLAPGTKAQLGKQYHKAAFPITFLETNIDYVGPVKILCKKEGELRELKEGEEYTVTYSGSAKGWKQYQYKIAASVFAQEGSYEVMLVSRDRAENSGDSLTQKKNVEFVIDRTAPKCLIMGMEKGAVYETKQLWITIVPRDNIRLKEMGIFVNGKAAAFYDKQEIDQQNGVIKWQLSSAEDWQRLQVKVTDEAGNQSWTEEIPVYVTEKKDIDIQPYIKTEKSARELEAEKEERPSVIVKTGDGIEMDETRKRETIKDEMIKEGMIKDEMVKDGRIPEKVIEDTMTMDGEIKKLPVDLLFYGVGGITLMFLLLTVSLRHFRRKR